MVPLDKTCIHNKQSIGVMPMLKTIFTNRKKKFHNLSSRRCGQDIRIHYTKFMHLSFDEYGFKLNKKHYGVSHLRDIMFLEVLPHIECMGKKIGKQNPTPQCRKQAFLQGGNSFGRWAHDVRAQYKQTPQRCLQPRAERAKFSADFPLMMHFWNKLFSKLFILQNHKIIINFQRFQNITQPRKYISS